MSFSAEERAILIAVKGVGPTVIKRFEELGINSLAALSTRTADDICGEVAGMLGTTCWKNAPRAKQAVTDAIAAAQAAHCRPQPERTGRLSSRS